MISIEKMPISTQADFYFVTKNHSFDIGDEIYRIGNKWYWMHTEYYAEFYAECSWQSWCGLYSGYDERKEKDESLNSMCWQAEMSGGEMWKTAAVNLKQSDLCLLLSMLVGKYPHIPNDKLSNDLLKPDIDKGYEVFSFADA